MFTSDNRTAVALVLAPGVAPDALAATAETLRSFEVSSLAVAPDDAVLLVTADRWRSVVVASPDAALPAAIAAALPLPVVRVPAAGGTASGLALLQAPGGNLFGPEKADAAFATVAIGEAGAKNAALFVISVLALTDDRLRTAWGAFRAAQTEAVLQEPPPRLD